MDFTIPRPIGASRDIWPTMRSNDQAAVNNQWHGNFDTHVNNQYPTYLSAPEQTSDSSCALSLLSTQPWGSTIAPPRSHETPLISANAQLNMASSYINSSWALGSSSSLEMGLKQLPDTGNSHFSSELELALQDYRQCPDPDELGHREVYDHDHCAMHWSL